MKSKSFFAAFIFVVILGIGLVCAYTAYSVSNTAESAIIAAGSFVIALIISSAIKIADQWPCTPIHRILRLTGKSHQLAGSLPVISC